MNARIESESVGGLKSSRSIDFSPPQCFFFRLSAVFWSALGALMCTFWECFFHQKHPKNFPRAPRALFWSKFREKHPSAAFGPTIRKTKNFSSCFFLLLSPCRRAQRGEIFVFSLGFFFWNGLRTEIESFEEVTI